MMQCGECLAQWDPDDQESHEPAYAVWSVRRCYHPSVTILCPKCVSVVESALEQRRARPR